MRRTSSSVQKRFVTLPSNCSARVPADFAKILTPSGLIMEPSRPIMMLLVLAIKIGRLLVPRWERISADDTQRCLRFDRGPFCGLCDFFSSCVARGYESRDHKRRPNHD